MPKNGNKSSKQLQIKKGGNVEAAKQTIKDAVVCTNQVKTEVKEYKALANKSFSKSSKK